MPHSCPVMSTFRLSPRFRWFVALAASLVAGELSAAVPHMINYQGRMAINGANFDGQGKFKFALVNGTGTQTYWRNSPDTAPADGVPDAAVDLNVSRGIYSLALGDTSIPNMAALPPEVFANESVNLRVWFSDGTHGWELLTPDQRIASVGYALTAETVADGAISTAKIAPGAITPDRLAPSVLTGYIDVTAYGADKTGATDCSAQVQAALNAAAASDINRTVFFPAGTYKCNFTLPAMVSIKGAGSRWWVLPPPYSKTTLIPARNADPLIAIKVMGGQRISNLTLTGNGHAVSNCGVKFTNDTDDYPGADVIFESCYVNRFSKGLWNRAGICIVATNLFVMDCMTCVLAEKSASNQTPSTTTFIGGQFGGMYERPAGAVCFQVEGNNGMNVIGCEMGNCEKVLVHTGAISSGTVISGGNIESLTGDCIMDIQGGFLIWSGTSVMCPHNTDIALVRVQGKESGITLNSLRCIGLDNYNSLGGVLAVETPETRDELIQVGGFEAVVRRTTDATFATTQYAYVPRRYPRDEYFALKAEYALPNQTTLADVPGLQVPLSPGRYHITGRIQMAHTANTGSKIALYYTGLWPAHVTDLRYGNSVAGEATEKTVGLVPFSIATPLAGRTFTQTGGEGSWASVDAIVTITDSGTLKWQVAKNALHADAAKISTGSYLRVKALP